MKAILIDLAPVPLDTPPEEVDRLWSAYCKYENAYLANPEAERVGRLRQLWTRARGRAAQVARKAASTIGRLAPSAIAFLRDMGRMAADLHLDEASNAKR